MERTFETPGSVHLTVENHAGEVVVTARATDRTIVSVEAGTPGAEELVERAIVESRRSGDRDHVVVKLRACTACGSCGAMRWSSGSRSRKVRWSL